MPPLVLFQTQRFLSSVNTASPAASSSPHVAPVHADEGDGAVAAGLRQHGRASRAGSP